MFSQATPAGAQAAFGSSSDSSVEERNARAMERLKQLEQARRQYFREKGDAVRVRPAVLSGRRRTAGASVVGLPQGCTLKTPGCPPPLTGRRSKPTQL